MSYPWKRIAGFVMVVGAFAAACDDDRDENGRMVSGPAEAARDENGGIAVKNGDDPSQEGSSPEERMGGAGVDPDAVGTELDKAKGAAVEGETSETPLMPQGPQRHVERTAVTAPLQTMTPEQFSELVEKTLGVTLTSNGEYNTKVDRITAVYGVDLGGVDFRLARERDPEPTLPKLLAIRRVAMDVAKKAFDTDQALIKAGKAPQVFTKVKLSSDVPAPAMFAGTDPAKRQKLIDADLRWQAQLDDLFFRLLGRKPEPDESAEFRARFRDIADAEGGPAWAWMFSLFAILSSAELWSL